MGTPLMPWQRLAADVIGEVDDRGRHAYPLVIISVPRQSGKTTLVMANSVHRSISKPGAKVWHTAQTGQDARKKWLEMTLALELSPLARLGTVKKTNGSEAVVFVNRSTFSPHPPTENSLHGEQSDLNNIDEAWSFDDARGTALMQAIDPTQATRPGAQIIILSTVGTASSTWFHKILDRAPGDPRIALFDWGIADDVDPSNLDAIAAAHPAYGNTIERETLEKAWDRMKDTPGDFARAYGNRRTGAAERLFPVAAWLACQTVAPMPAGTRPAFAAAVDRDRSSAAIVAAAYGSDGRPVLEVIEHRPGVEWCAPVLAGLAGRWSGHAVAIDRHGPAATVADELDRTPGVTVMPIGTAEATTAAADLYDRITDQGRPRVQVRTHPAMTAAADIAGRRSVGDRWVIDRKTPAGSVAPLEAAGLALFALTHAPAAPVAPRIWTA